MHIHRLLRPQKHIFTYLLTSIIIILLFNLIPFHKTFAASSSPSFELQEIQDDRQDWVQVLGNNNNTQLKSYYTDILAVNYLSNGKTLNVTYWLSSALENASIYNQPFRNISYGMLIDADSNIKTGYNGADYEFYIESANGKWNKYLYQFSSTGAYL